MIQSGSESHAWPLLFSHHGTILGKGFLADIEIHGRILATPEAEGIWVDGVNPGAIALGAATLNDTHVELRNTLARVFIDFAEQTASYEEFCEKVEEFFNATDPDTEHAWAAAVAAVRAGRITGPEGIQRQNAETRRYVKITRKAVEAITPKDNTIVQQESQDYYAAVA